MNDKNLLLLTDSYKASHFKQYPAGTEEIYSYFESRGGKFEETVFFGLQYIIKKYLSTQITQADVDFAAGIFEGHLGPGTFNRAGWEHIVDDHHGWLPLEIKAVAEGTVVPTHNVLMTVRNTCPRCFWLTNYMETLLVQTWYPTTVATISRQMKKRILRALKSTGDESLISFKLHDFGCRGVSTMESAGIGGLAHLVNFMGTDTIPALVAARQYYGERMAGFSIPASEHSTITSWGQEGELEAFRNMLTQYPTGLVACVSDSFDIYAACKDLWGTKLKAEVLGRNGTLVIRPDSGNPHEVVVRILDILGDQFGYLTNAKGYKVLDPHVRVIQGDGIDVEELDKIIGAMTASGWSADNIAYGMGGALLQRLDRDTQKFAFKCSSITINGQQKDVFKDPVEAKWKSSKKGLLRLEKNEAGEFKTVRRKKHNGQFEPLAMQEPDLLEVRYFNGNFIRETTLAQVRENAAVVLED